MHIGGYLKIPRSQKGHVTITIGASAIEALIGAVWIDSDCNYSKVHHAVHTLSIGVKLLESSSHDFGE